MTQYHPPCDKSGCLHPAQFELLCYWDSVDGRTTCWNVCAHHHSYLVAALKWGLLAEGKAPARIVEARNPQW